MIKELPEFGSELETLCVNTIRTLSMDAVQKANSGHPGAPMGLASAAYVLWTRFMNHNPKNPAWLDRDRFVLSGGHASMLLYSLLHLTGYDVSLEDLKNFRQWGSKTPGHPEFGHTSGVETTTGPLGQGFANAVGMAMAERHLAACYNRESEDIVDHYTYVMCGDGDMMEGVASEAASLAGHLGLARLICLYDDNKISIEGSTDITFTEDVAKRFEAYGWHVQKVADGCDVRAIAEAIAAAKAETGKPSLIAVRTHIACGSPNKQDSCEAHGAPLGEAEVRLTKKNLNWDENATFLVPEKALAVFRKCLEAGASAESVWMEKFSIYIKKYPDLAKKWADAMSGYLTDGWDGALPKYTVADKPVSTRVASGKVLNAIAKNLPTLMGGSADLAPSNMTFLDGMPEFQKDHYEGRNIRFGVREHALGAILSGLFLHNGIRPYGGTFLVFADYMRGAIRVASIMKLPVIYVLTHDSIAVGEDGPTHQPIEHVASLRAIPGLTVIRPADANETAEAWRTALMTHNGPTALILSRQNLPILAGEGYKTGVARGAYIAADCDGKPELILIATGSEVSITLKAKAELDKQGVKVRVVSMPSWELFDRMPEEYRNEILPPGVEKRMAVEAGISMGWEKYVGSKGCMAGISGFGASAPGNVVMEKYGFTVENIVAKALECLKG
jgi:transketolase